MKVVQELGKRIKGPMGEREDWWRLIVTPGGEQAVEHEWSHTALNTLKTNSGTKIYQVAEFLELDSPQASGAQRALREILGL